MALSNVNLTPSTTPTTLQTNTPRLLTITDFSSQFPLLRSYYNAVDPLAYITATILSYSDAFISELTNFINRASQTNAELHSL